MPEPTVFINVFTDKRRHQASSTVHESRKEAFREAEEAADSYAFTLTDLGKVVFKLRDDEDGEYGFEDWKREHATGCVVNGEAV